MINNLDIAGVRVSAHTKVGVVCAQLAWVPHYWSYDPVKIS